MGKEKLLFHFFEGFCSFEPGNLFHVKFNDRTRSIRSFNIAENCSSKYKFKINPFLFNFFDLSFLT